MKQNENIFMLVWTTFMVSNSFQSKGIYHLSFRFAVFTAIFLLFWGIILNFKRKNHPLYQEIKAWNSHDWDEGRFKGSMGFYILIIIYYLLSIFLADNIWVLFH